MYLRTPKRYTARGRKSGLINLRWLWLYLIAIPIIIVGALGWEFRSILSGRVGEWTNRNVRINISQPTPTPTIPASDLTRTFTEAVRGGRMNSAISALSGLGDLAPNDVGIFTTLTRFTLFRGDPTDPQHKEKALELAQMAVNANPEVADGWIMMALALNKLDRSEEALPYALRARDLDAENPLLAAVTAEIYYDLNELDTATTLADQAIVTAKAANPANSFALMYAYWVKGLTLQEISGEAALAQYEQAYRATQVDQSLPAGFIAQEFYGFYRDDRSNEFIEIIQDAAKRDKDDPIMPYFLGRVYWDRKNYEQARPFFAQCLDIDPVQLRCLRWFAQVSYAQDNYKAAADSAQKAIDNGSQEPEAYLLAGLSYVLQVPPLCDRAIGLLQKGYILNEENPNPDSTAVRKQLLREQFDGGLSKCNSTAVRPTPNPTSLFTPTLDAPVTAETAGTTDAAPTVAP